jgi:hypothetical protein
MGVRLGPWSGIHPGADTSAPWAARGRRVIAAAAVCGLLLLAGCGGGDRFAGSTSISACMDPQEARSADIRRNLAALRGAPVCYRLQQVREGGFHWTFHLLEHTRAPDGPFWVLPHDDENAAFDAAVHAVLAYGGGLLAVDAGGRRTYRGQDPNRNFSTSRGESRLCVAQHRPAPRYTRAILDHYRGRRGPMLALHNNGDGHAGNGGYGNISMLRTGPMLSHWPGAAGNGSPALRDEDNLIFVAGRRSAYADPTMRRRIAALNGAGLNVIHKQVTDRSFDCSLSDYVARHGLGEYYNLEAEHGARATQIEMVDRLMAVLGIRALRTRDARNPFLG